MINLIYGDVVALRNGELYMILPIGNRDYLVNDEDVISYERYRNGECPENHQLDIVMVYSAKDPIGYNYLFQDFTINTFYWQVIWKKDNEVSWTPEGNVIVNGIEYAKIVAPARPVNDLPQPFDELEAKDNG